MLAGLLARCFSFSSADILVGSTPAGWRVSHLLIRPEKGGNLSAVKDTKRSHKKLDVGHIDCSETKSHYKIPDLTSFN